MSTETKIKLVFTFGHGAGQAAAVLQHIILPVLRECFRSNQGHIPSMDLRCQPSKVPNSHTVLVSGFTQPTMDPKLGLGLLRQNWLADPNQAHLVQLSDKVQAIGTELKRQEKETIKDLESQNPPHNVTSYLYYLGLVEDGVQSRRLLEADYKVNQFEDSQLAASLNLPFLRWLWAEVKKHRVGQLWLAARPLLKKAIEELYIALQSEASYLIRRYKLPVEIPFAAEAGEVEWREAAELKDMSVPQPIVHQYYVPPMLMTMGPDNTFWPFGPMAGDDTEATEFSRTYLDRFSKPFRICYGKKQIADYYREHRRVELYVPEGVLALLDAKPTLIG